jgi:folate-dependent phosphoribosylglycinamide formyltransferase PurN
LECCRAGDLHAYSLSLFETIFATKKKKNSSTIYLDLTTIPAEKIKRIDKLSSTKEESFCKELKPDLLIVNGTRILSKKTLESVSAPFVNIHTGITPAYRGVHGGYLGSSQGAEESFWYNNTLC